MSTFFRNTLFSGLDLIILIILSFLATPILIQNFGVDGYGAFVFLSVFSVYGMLSFFDLGMEGSLMNHVARIDANGDTTELEDTLSISLVYYVALGSILGVILYLCGDIIASRMLGEHSSMNKGEALTAMTYVSINIVIQFITLPFAAILQGLRQFAIVKSINSAMNIVRYVLLIVIAVKFHRIDLAFLVVMCLSSVTLVAYVVMFFLRLTAFRGMRPRFNLALLRHLFSYSSILFVNRLIGLLCNQVDKFLIWFLQAVASMTIYDVVSRPANLLRLVLSVLNSAIIPEVARLHQLNDLSSLRRLFVDLVRYAYLILFPLLAVLFVFMDYLLRAWVGELFASSAYLALILLSTYLVLPIPSIASTMVVGMEKVKQTMWISIAYTLVKVVGSLILLNVIGLAGLMIGTLVAELFYLAPYSLSMKKFLEMEIDALVKPLLPIVAVGAVAAGSHLLVRLLLSDNYIAVGSCAGTILVIHAVVNYRFLLYDNERSYLKQVLRSPVIPAPKWDA